MLCDVFVSLVNEILLVQNNFFSLKCIFRARLSEKKADKNMQINRKSIKTISNYQLIFQCLLVLYRQLFD